MSRHRLRVGEILAAVRHCRSLIQEHDSDPNDFLRLTPTAEEVLLGALSTQIEQTKIPRSRRVYRGELMRFLKIGIAIGIQIGAAREEMCR